MTAFVQLASSIQLIAKHAKISVVFHTTTSTLLSASSVAIQDTMVRHPTIPAWLVGKGAHFALEVVLLHALNAIHQMPLSTISFMVLQTVIVHVLVVSMELIFKIFAKSVTKIASLVTLLPLIAQVAP